MNDHTLALLDLLAKGTAVLLLGFGCISFMRRLSAAHRSLAWLAVFGALLLLPLAIFVRPVWTVDVPVVKQRVQLAGDPVPLVVEKSGTEDIAPAPTSESVAAPAWTVWQWLAAFYVSGVALVLGFRLIGSWQLGWLKRQHAREFDGEARVRQMVRALCDRHGIRRNIRVLQSDRAIVPMTWGVFNPVLMMPSACSDWTDDDLRAALEHEMAHIRHCDAARRWLATFVCALWWPHPLVWIASKSWRLEQERACDDVVVRSGSDAARYAAQLLDAAKSVRLGRFESAAALVMAMPSGLETRLRSVVGSNVNRAAAGRAAFWITAAAGLFVVTICAVCHAQTAAAPVRDKRQILITTKFIEAPVADIAARLSALKSALDGKPTLLSDAEMQELVGQLSQKKGVNLMSTPTVTTRSGQKATIEVAREFMYPTEFEMKDGGFSSTHFEMKPVGITVDLNASFESGNAIRLKPATATVSEFLGFLVGGRVNLKEVGKGKWRFDDSKPFVGRENKISDSARAGGIGRVTDVTGKMKSTRQNDVKKDEVTKPVFSSRKWSGDVSLQQGEWMLGCLTSENDAGAKDGRRVWFFVSAKEVNSDEQKQTAIPKPAEEKTTLQKARRIIVPQVEFKDAKLSEAVEFLRVKSQELDSDGQGINIIIKDGGVPVQSQITLSLRAAPLNELLRYVTELSGMAAVYESFAVIVRPLSTVEGDAMYTRVYRVPATLLGTETDAKKWLAIQRVVFQEGASAVFNKAESKLLVKNVPQELRKVEAILENLGVQTKEPDPPIVKRAQAIIIPRIEFSGATIEEAVQFLQGKSRQFDPDKQGVNIVLTNPEPKSTAQLALSLKDVPLWEALRYVAELAGMRLEAGESAIVIRPWGAPAGKK